MLTEGATMLFQARIHVCASNAIALSRVSFIPLHFSEKENHLHVRERERETEGWF